MTKNDIDYAFNLLDKWDEFPNYQLERRADIFFALYLPIILNAKGIEISHDYVIPEFPLKVEGSNKSKKIDYVVFCKKDKKKVYFIELKTSMKSLKNNQLKNIKEATISFHKLVSDIKEIVIASKSDKYIEFVKCLGKCLGIKELENIEKKKDIEKFNPPEELHEKKIEIIYIQPIDEKKLAGTVVITFSEIRESIKDKKGYLAKRFRVSLKAWEDRERKIYNSKRRK